MEKLALIEALAPVMVAGCMMITWPILFGSISQTHSNLLFTVRKIPATTSRVTLSCNMPGPGISIVKVWLCLMLIPGWKMRGVVRISIS